MNPSTSICLERGNPELQDRAEVLSLGDRRVVILADGVGGISGGARAADWFIRGVREAAAGLASAEACWELMRRLDGEIAEANVCGETTGIVVVLRAEGLFGASVGDSAAWLFAIAGRTELTGGQMRKPFLGSGTAWPHRFEQRSVSGTLVVATDGLWKYTSLEVIEKKARAGAPEKLATELAELVRMRSGGFQDDVGIVTVAVAD